MLDTKIIFIFICIVLTIVVLQTLYKVYLRNKTITENFYQETTGRTTNRPETTGRTTNGPETTGRTTGETTGRTTNGPEQSCDNLASIYRDDLKILRAKVLDLQKKINKNNNLNNGFQQKINNKSRDIDGKQDKLKQNLEELGSFHDNYSKELQKILQERLNFIDPAFDTNQEIQSNRLKEIEKSLSEIEIKQMKLSNQTDAGIRSIVCKANSTKLNVLPITQDGSDIDSVEFVIWLNGGLIEPNTNAENNNIKTSSDSKSDEKYRFKLLNIKNYNDYNDAIKRHTPRDGQKLVTKYDDINYPFKLIVPKNGQMEGKCLYIKDKNEGKDIYISIDSIKSSPHNRFKTSVVGV